MCILAVFIENVILGFGISRQYHLKCCLKDGKQCTNGFNIKLPSFRTGREMQSADDDEIWPDCRLGSASDSFC